MSFCIMRTAKLKSGRDVVMTLQHNTRDRMPQNADPSRKADNFIFGGNTLESMARWGTLCPEYDEGKVRKNAVLAVEMVFTASPDFKGDWNAYLKESSEWAMGIFGAENVLHIAHHHDETTPHAHVLFVPKKDGKLNARHFIGGHRDRMAELQTDFFEKVGKKFDMERGHSRQETNARHSHPTLAGKSAELDQREEKIKHREKVLSEFEKQYRDLRGVSPGDILQMKNDLANWKKQSPAGLRVVADNIARSGAATVKEYQEKLEQDRQRQQGIRR